MLGNQDKIVSQLYDATQLKNLCLLFIPTALQIAGCTPYETLPFPPRFLAQVQMSRGDIRCKSNRRRDDIPFPREPAQCARGRRLRPRRRRGEGGEGAGGKGRERMFGTWHRNPLRATRSGKVRFIRRDNNEMNVADAPPPRALD